MALKKNQRIPLTVTGLTAEGSGVGRYEGQVVFVPGTAVGDVIDCHVVKVQQNIAFGRVAALCEPSPDRVADAGCPAFGKCGGCTYRHISYEAELRAKWQRVADALHRIGGLDIEPAPIVGSRRTDRYRNKAQFPVGCAEGRAVAGFFAPRSHRVVPVDDCALQPAVFAPITAAVLGWVEANGVSVYDEATRKGLLRHIYLREAGATGQILLCLVCTSGKLPAPDALIDAVRRASENVVGIVVNLNREDTNVILGNKSFTLWGQETVTDRLCGLTLRLSPLSFYQINRDQTEVLYGLAAEAAGLTGRETLLDLYCGTGTIGLSMAEGAAQLIGVEVVSAAVEDARRNAAENGVTNARFICDDAAGAAAQLAAEGVSPDVVILDPPRKGCDAALIDTVAQMAPDRVVYVSCDPATLARDLARFAEKGYVTTRVTPVDMFPRTPHVESVVCLTRK